MTEDKEISPVEIQIPVPWGHIAGKNYQKLPYYLMGISIFKLK